MVIACILISLMSKNSCLILRTYDIVLIFIINLAIFLVLAITLAILLSFNTMSLIWFLRNLRVSAIDIITTRLIKVIFRWSHLFFRTEIFMIWYHNRCLILTSCWHMKCISLRFRKRCTKEANYVLIRIRKIFY